jgi:FMN phosphatase YigB (HAD superfamily)
LRGQRERHYDVVVVDLDNTLYDWVRYFAGTLRAVLGRLGPAIGISEDELVEQFRQIYSTRGSLEYAFIVQELPATRGMTHTKVESLIETAQRTSAESRRRLLRPYAGVTETLRDIRAAGITIIALTNAPFFQAHRRLRQLALLEFVDALGAWEGFSVPAGDPYVRHVRDRLARGEYVPKVAKHRAFGREDLKPSKTMFRWALDVCEVAADRTLVVGDSVAKDVAPAMSLGTAGAWSAYGAEHDPQDFELLVRVTPWQKGEVTDTYAAPHNDPCTRLGKFSDLRRTLGVSPPHPAAAGRGLRAVRRGPRR